MPDTLSCPTCGAPIPSPGKESSTSCPYCGQLVAVPESFRVQWLDSRLTADKIQEIVTFIRAGQRIQAIKALRHACPQGLKAAKDAVDEVQALLAQSPSANYEKIGAILTRGAASVIPDDTPLETRHNTSTLVWTLGTIIVVTFGLILLLLLVIR